MHVLPFELKKDGDPSASAAVLLVFSSMLPYECSELVGILPPKLLQIPNQILFSRQTKVCADDCCRILPPVHRKALVTPTVASFCCALHHAYTHGSL